MKITVFGRRGCDACKAAMEKLDYFSRKWGKREATDIEFIDVDTPDGLAEGAYRDVYEVPTVIFDEAHEEVARWVKQVPLSEDFRKYFGEGASDERPPD